VEQLLHVLANMLNSAGPTALAGVKMRTTRQAWCCKTGPQYVEQLLHVLASMLNYAGPTALAGVKMPTTIPTRCESHGMTSNGIQQYQQAVASHKLPEVEVLMGI
jgi:hypothetical protein